MPAVLHRRSRKCWRIRGSSVQQRLKINARVRVIANNTVTGVNGVSGVLGIYREDREKHDGIEK